MKVNKRFKKGTALVLAAALVASLAPVLPGIGTKSRAEDEGSNIPSVQVYADVAKLTGSTFDPGSDGTSAEAVAKLKFGSTDASGTEKAIEWYILGPDENIDGEGSNIAIFATDIIGRRVFYGDSSYHTYEGDEDEKYVKGSRTSESDKVAPNHYGESDIRTALRRMADKSDTAYNYFSAAEKDLMQETKVLTHEYDNEDMLYTTNDMLYLPSGVFCVEDGKGVIYVGGMSEDADTGTPSVNDEYKSKALQCDTYWKRASEGGSDEWFWLRSPNPDDNYSFELYAAPSGGDVFSSLVYIHNGGVRPASNLNLSSVLFASAAEAGTATEVGEVSTLTPSDVLNDDGEGTQKQDAMTLRMKGDSESAKTALDGGTIGGVKTVGDKVEVTRGTTEKTVTLIIQGKDAGDATGTDWYYAKTITADNAGDAVTASKITGHENTDLSDCKIWLEAKGTDGLIYAVNTEAVPAHVHVWSTTLTAYNGEKHGYACTDENCPNKGTEAGFKDLADHTYGDANVCTECGYRQGEHVVTVKETSATSTSVGYKKHFECSDCGKWFRYPAVAGVLIEESKSYFEIPATGGSSNSGTTYSDGSTRNSDRYSSVSSSASQNSLGSLNSSGLTASSNSTSSWSKDTSGKWWYYDGNVKIVGWVYDKSDGRWYYVDANKGRVYGWFYDTDDSYWYYLDANTGAMLTGWQLIGGKQYYFAPAPAAATYTFDTASSKWVYSNAANYRPYGSMHAGTTTPDNHSVDADGAKIQ